MRYLYIGLNDSNLTPARADDTWQRRFGDCKGKTVLLLALLDGLGIAAEPALVSTRIGDGLDQRLPNASQFDHVIVRATIGGKVFWLDGTRLGDRKLGDIDVPDFHRALPLHSGHSALEPLVVPPRQAPTTVYDLTLDAAKGVWAPAAAHGEVRFVGDAGVVMHNLIAATSASALDQQLKAFWLRQYDFITPTNVTESWDDASRTERFAMDGTARMAWNDAGNNQRRYEMDNAAIGWRGDFRRQPGPDSDAPFSLAYPDYVEYHETVLLPDGGLGFSLAGQNVDQTLARTELFRHTELAGNRVTMVVRQRPLARELPYAEAQAADTPLRALADNAVNIMLDSQSYVDTADDLRTMRAAPIGSAGEQGYQLRVRADLLTGDIAAGTGDAAAYLAAYPASAAALASRALFEAAAGQPTVARADAKAALASNPDEPNAKLIEAYYASYRAGRQFDGAMPGFLTWVKWIAAESARNHQNYAAAERLANEALAMQSNVSMIYVTLANAYKGANDLAAATHIAERMIAAAPKDPDMLAVAGVILCATGACDKGRAAFAASLALTPSLVVYLNDLRFRPRDDIAGRKRDIDGALKLAPGDPDTLLALANWQGETGDKPGQLATLEKLATIKAADDEPDINFAIKLGAAYARAGQPHKARASFALARGYAMASRDGGRLNDVCYTAAELNFDLDLALADCTRAVALKPGVAGILDSLAFVQLRLGHLDEAIAGYDKALAANPRAYNSLYGRGIARIRHGQSAQGRADIAAARALNPEIAQVFNAMGVMP